MRSVLAPLVVNPGFKSQRCEADPFPARIPGEIAEGGRGGESPLPGGFAIPRANPSCLVGSGRKPEPDVRLVGADPERGADMA